MTDIQVGEYVRFRDGNIRKVIKRNVDNEIILDRLWRYGCGVTWVTKTEEKEDITNHSFNIIDLIEVGDYVNEVKIGKEELFDNGLRIISEAIGDCYYETTFRSDKPEEVKTIVTHERFKSMEYKVGEEDD